MKEMTRREFCKESATVAIAIAAFPDIAFGQSKRGGTKPFVKWAGGKGQLLGQLEALLPHDFSTRKDLVYVEPFVGGGAMLFNILAA
jgi:DNA adenine methylase